ncbi:MAG: vacuolar iron transporter family protein, partial [Acidimicrobiaceae bacterium]
MAVTTVAVPADPPMREAHRGERSGWLRAAVLGADDGIVSVASVAIGVIASGATRSAVLTAAVAALVAGAMSMAAGEYVSVSTQRDTELGDLAQERNELARDPAGETR